MRKVITKSICILLLVCLTFSCSFVSVSAKGDSVKFATKKVVLTTGEKFSQKLLDNGKKVNNQSKWSSNDKTIATVKQGVVTAKSKGTVILKAVYKNKTYKFTVVVKNASFKEKKLTLKIGQSFKQVLKGANGNINASKVDWCVENSEVATVSKKGVVKGIKKGRTVAYAKYKGNKISFKIVVISQTQKDCAGNYELLKQHIIDYGEKNKEGNKFISNFDYGLDYDYEFGMIYNQKTEKIDFLFFATSYDYEYVDSMLSFSIGKNSYSSKLEAYFAYGYGSEILGEAIGISKIYLNTFDTTTSLNFDFDEESTSWLANEKNCNKLAKVAFEYFDMLIFAETGLTLGDIGFVSYTSDFLNE